MLLALRTLATATPQILGVFLLLLSARGITTASTKARRFTACKAMDPSSQYQVVHGDFLVLTTRAATLGTTAKATQVLMALMVNQFACLLTNSLRGTAPVTQIARATRTTYQLTNVELNRDVTEEVVMLFSDNVIHLLPHSTQAFGTTPTVILCISKLFSTPCALLTVPAAYNSM
jgi:hypothetical protein